MAQLVLILIPEKMIFRRNKNVRRDSSIGLDLGTHQIKAVVLQRDGETFKVDQYAVAPIAAAVGKADAVPAYAAELQKVLAQLGVSECRARVALSCSTAMVCHAEFPRVPLDEIKSALQINSSFYLRHDYSNYYLDVFEFDEGEGEAKAKKSPKMKVLVGGASRDEVSWYRSALSAAKIRAETIELAAVSVINAFQTCNPQACAPDQTTLLLDIGADATSINLLRGGMPVMTRITDFGGSRISEHISQVLTLPMDAAEEEKRRMSDPVQPLIRHSLAPLVREIRSSIDFFERQHECRVSGIFPCGGSACSAPLLQLLGEEVGVPIEAWNPVAQMDISHLNGEGPKLTALAPTLAAAIGAAAAGQR